MAGFAHISQIISSSVAYAGQRESGLFGLVGRIPPSIAHILFLYPAGLHSSDTLRPVNLLGSRMPVQMYSLATDGKCTPAVGSMELHRHYKRGLHLLLNDHSPNIHSF